MKQSKLNFGPKPRPIPVRTVPLTTLQEENVDDPLPVPVLPRPVSLLVNDEQSHSECRPRPTSTGNSTNKQTFLNFPQRQTGNSSHLEKTSLSKTGAETAIGLGPRPIPSPGVGIVTHTDTPTGVGLGLEVENTLDMPSPSMKVITNRPSTPSVSLNVTSTKIVGEKRKLHSSDGPKLQPKRKFNRKWLNEFSWLSYSEESNTAMCNKCCQLPKSGVDLKWVTGLKAPFKKETFLCHEKSQFHKENIEHLKAKEAPSETPLALCIKKMDAVMFQHMTHLFNIAYYIAVNEKPFSDFPKLLTLACKLEVPILKKYGNDMQCREFIHHIAKSIQSEILTSVRKSTFITILVDGSTDRTNVENATIYVRYVSDGCVREDILGLVSLPNSTSTGYLESITNLLDALELDYRQKFWIISLGTDGAASMVGHKSGLAVQMGKICDRLISIHCVAHRLQLAMLDVCKSIPYIPMFDKAVRTVYKFYRGSPKRLHQLKDTAAALCEEIMKLKDIHAVRWLSSKMDALRALAKNWTSVVTHMENLSSESSDAAAKAKGILRDLKDYKFVKLLHFLLDFYMKLRPLSMALQLKDIMICDLNTKIEHSISVMDELCDSPGDNETVFLKNFKEDNIYGIQLTFVIVGERMFQSIREKVLKNAKHYLQERLSSVSSELVQGVEIFDSLRWPDKEQLMKYGKTEMALLGKHIFQSDLDTKIDLLQAEWADYKFMFRDQLFKEALKKVNANKDRFPTLLPVITFCATLPVSTASCERGFSYQNRIKTDYRSCLKTTTMDDLMMVAVNGPPLEAFKPENSIDRWYFSSQRDKYVGTGSSKEHELRQ